MNFLKLSLLAVSIFQIGVINASAVSAASAKAVGEAAAEKAAHNAAVTTTEARASSAANFSSFNRKAHNCLPAETSSSAHNTSSSNSSSSSASSSSQGSAVITTKNEKDSIDKKQKSLHVNSTYIATAIKQQPTKSLLSTFFQATFKKNNKFNHQLPRDIFLKYISPAVGLHLDLFPITLQTPQIIVGDDDITSSKLSPDGSKIAIACNSTIKIYNANDGSITHTYDNKKAYFRFVAWNPNGKSVAALSHKNSIFIWDTDNGQCIELPSSGNIFKWSPDGTKIVTWYECTNKPANIFDTKNGKIIYTLTVGKEGFDSIKIAWSRDGKKIAAMSKNNTIKIYDAQNGNEICTLDGHKEEIRSIDWNHSGEFIATASLDDTVKVWNTQNGHCERTIENIIVASIAWSPIEDLTLAVQLRHEQAIRIYNETGEMLHVDHTEEESIYTDNDALITAYAWSPDGNTIAVGLSSEKIKIWDAKKGNLILTLLNNQRHTSSIEWSSDNNKILSSHLPSTMWNIGSFITFYHKYQLDCDQLMFLWLLRDKAVNKKKRLLLEPQVYEAFTTFPQFIQQVITDKYGIMQSKTAHTQDQKNAKEKENHLSSSSSSSSNANNTTGNNSQNMSQLAAADDAAAKEEQELKKLLADDWVVVIKPYDHSPIWHYKKDLSLSIHFIESPRKQLSIVSLTYYLRCHCKSKEQKYRCYYRVLDREFFWSHFQFNLQAPDQTNPNFHKARPFLILKQIEMVIKQEGFTASQLKELKAKFLETYNKPYKTTTLKWDHFIIL